MHSLCCRRIQPDRVFPPPTRSCNFLHRPVRQGTARLPHSRHRQQELLVLVAAALHDGDIRVWDSLAICEYLHERFHEHYLWPADAAPRAEARSVSAEMHAGFGALREHMSMNIRARYPGQGRTPECLADIERIVAIWTDCRMRFGDSGDFLFGRFGIADAMVAPLVLRFQTYGVALPALQAWVADAEAEAERIEKFDRNE